MKAEAFCELKKEALTRHASAYIRIIRFEVLFIPLFKIMFR